MAGFIGPCHFCDARCCREMVLTVTSFDIFSISKVTGMHWRDFSELTEAKLLKLNNQTVLECDDSYGTSEYVLSLKSRPCIFLKDNRCNIYQFAPLVCKLYPFTFQGKKISSPLCGLTSQILFDVMPPFRDVAKAFFDNLRAYEQIVKKWNKFERYRCRGTKEECMEFLLEETYGILLENANAEV